MLQPLDKLFDNLVDWLSDERDSLKEKVKGLCITEV